MWNKKTAEPKLRRIIFLSDAHKYILRCDLKIIDLCLPYCSRVRAESSALFSYLKSISHLFRFVNSFLKICAISLFLPM